MSTTSPRIIVATKLHIPAARPGYVRRRALVAALEAADDAGIVLLSAPPGTGKTTLLAEWCAAAGGREVAWLSLDAEDSDPVQFWACVIEALRRVRPEIGVAAQATLEAPGTNLTASVLPLLVNELAAAEDPIALVLDDYHLISDAGVHGSMVWLIDHRPACLQIVVATRSDPPFGLARLRARRLLVELRAADLRFSDEEATGLLNGALGLRLTDADVHRLQLRTEGWAVGLQLAGLSLRGRPAPAEFIEAFAGDDRQIVDYLGAEVLDTQPPDLRRFMRRTSILGRLCGPLCDAVTGEEGSAALLETIEHLNLFLVPLDEKRRWYRYHHLFGDLLRHDLEIAEPDRVADLHRRAAAWLDEEGDFPEAVHHALAGGDEDKAAELAATHWSELFNRGRLATVSRWLSALPAERVAADSRLWLARVWTSMDRGRLEDVASLLEAADGDPAATTRPWVTVLTALHRFKAGDVGRAHADAERAIVRDADPPAFRRTVALLVRGVAEHWRGELAAAHATLTDARTVALADANGLAALYATGYLALGALELGDLHESDDELAKASALTDGEPGLGEHFVVCAAQLAAGRRSLLRGRAEEAVGELDRAVELARRGASLVELAACLRALGEAHRARKDRGAARRATAEARDVLARCPDPGRLGEPSTVAPQPRAEATDELSERELAVLRLLPTELSQREIGRTLYVSLNTVKSHTRRVFAKLDASSREEAVEKARARGLL